MSAPASRRAGPTPEQRAAADPSVSAWVSASAGSGKTFVLARRVLRLLRNGVAPGRILCLTFTRAAAAEMTSRVFAELGRWTTLDDAALADVLRNLDGAAPGPEDLAQARRLFAIALETPGGLKIQTIHAFAERVLHRFPFEANVAAHFSVLDDIEAAELRDEALAAVLARAGREPDGPLGAALDRVAACAGDARFGEIVAGALGKRAELRRWIDSGPGLDNALVGLAAALGADPATAPAAIRAEICASPHFPVADWPAAIDMFSRGSANDRAQADRLARALAGSGEARCDAYLALFVAGTGNMRARVLTAPLAGECPELAAALEREQARLAGLVERLRAQDCFAASAALFRLVHAVLDGYERSKSARGLLDYDDLIAKTVDLLTRKEATQWVLYKLDGGIDHILIDEAQDTSPQQWEIVGRLAEEGLAGEDGRTRERTLFAVGDEKQSIYSFQGADPAKFDEMRRFFERRTRAAGKSWRGPELTVSYRSGPAVLEAVNRVFAAPAARAGIAAGTTPVEHTPYRSDAAGLVELWPVETAGKAPATDPWDAPLDRFDEESPRARLARRIADTIAGWLACGTPLDATGEPIRPGDILILVRRRNAFVDALVSALRERDVPVAGADRLVVQEHIAVMDLLVAADVALLPEDDLALATLLKSPLVGLSEDELLDLAAGRDGTLMRALAARVGEPPYAAAADFVARLRAIADFAPPFAFFAELLGPMGGRRRLLSRLGPEAADALNEFLDTALDYERGAVPSLQGFVHAARARRIEITRNMDQVRGEVRIMTVHGAKGLEAPVVILPDTCDIPDGRHDDRLVALEAAGDGAPPLAWAVGPGAIQPAAVKAARERRRAAQMAEYRRLLYVAMTRARDNLHVCGARSRDTLPEGCWYALVADGLRPVLAEVRDGDGAVVAWRMRRGTAAAAVPPAGAAAPAPEGGELPDWARRPAAPAPERTRLLVPSAAGGEDRPVRPETEDMSPGALAPRRRGTLIHALVERLPDLAPAQRERAGRRLAGALAPDLAAPARDAIVREVLALLDEPALAPLFGPGSRAEVAVGGQIAAPRDDEPAPVISGQIDRLAVTGDEVLIADYKTGRTVPDRVEEIPPGYIAQLAAYRRAIGQIFPGKTIRAFLVWTAGPGASEIPPALLDRAEAELLAAPDRHHDGANPP